ncbi:MAG: hypothetical protein V1809_05585 [Planctomycetota bacterium]
MRLLRLFLFIGCLGWIISIAGVVLPWDVITTGLQGLGAKEIPPDPMMNYWLRMTGGAYTILGVLYGLAGANPRKYAALIPVLGWSSLLEGIVLAIYGTRLGLPPFPFLADTTFCLLVGFGILATQKHLVKAE